MSTRRSPKPYNPGEAVMTSHQIVVLAAMLSMSLMAASCSKPQPSAAYQAACQGPPLRTVEKRQKAMEDGYDINREHDCITKASFAAIAEERAKRQAANTPEAIAQRQAQWDKEVAEERARRAAAESQPVAPAPPAYVLRHVDVNTATESDLAYVVGPEVAAQVLEERKKGRFNGWTDLANRVIGLHAAQSAGVASISGLNVDGQSLSGAPPDATMAGAIAQRRQKN